MSTAILPVISTVTRSLTYFGRRAAVTTEHHDKSRVGLRTISTVWLDNADERNGSYPAGTITMKTVKGDGRIVSGPSAFVVVKPETILA